MENGVLQQLINSNGFWTIVGIIFGSSINFVIWIIQSRSKRKYELLKIRLKKAEEIAEMLNVLDERIKTAQINSSNSNIIVFWTTNPDFWKPLQLIKTRIVIKALFPKSIKLFDELQLSLKEFIDYIHEIMETNQYSMERFSFHFERINQCRNNFINSLDIIF